MKDETAARGDGSDQLAKAVSKSNRGVRHRRRDDDLRDIGAYALRLANLNYSVGMIEEALLRHPAFHEVQGRRGTATARRRAHDKAEWAIRFVAEHPRDEWATRILARIVAYREAADAYPWLGRTGPTDRRVLEAFYLSGTFAKSTKFRFAARTIESRTTIPWRTAAESVRRHCHDWRTLRKVGNYGEGLGTKYQIAAPVSWNLHNRQSPPAPIVPELGMRPPGDRLVESVLKHEAFRNRGLGDAGWMLTHWLRSDEEATRSQLASATGMGYERVGRVLNALRRAEIAREIDGGWVRVPDVELLPTLDAFVALTSPHLLLVQERGTAVVANPRNQWWIAWWGSLSEKATRRAA